MSNDVAPLAVRAKRYIPSIGAIRSPSQMMVDAGEADGTYRGKSIVAIEESTKSSVTFEAGRLSLAPRTTWPSSPQFPLAGANNSAWPKSWNFAASGDPVTPLRETLMRSVGVTASALTLT